MVFVDEPEEPVRPQVERDRRWPQLAAVGALAVVAIAGAWIWQVLVNSDGGDVDPEQAAAARIGWAELRDCLSDGDYGSEGVAGSGAYRLDPEAWESVVPRDVFRVWPSAGEAPPAVQDAAAADLFADDGASAFGDCENSVVGPAEFPIVRSWLPGHGVEPASGQVRVFLLSSLSDSASAAVQAEVRDWAEAVDPFASVAASGSETLEVTFPNRLPHERLPFTPTARYVTDVRVVRGSVSLAPSESIENFVASRWVEGVDLMVFLRPGVEEAEIDEVRAVVQDWASTANGAAEIAYVDQDDALKEFEELVPDDSEPFFDVTADILPASFRVNIDGPVPVSTPDVEFSDGSRVVLSSVHARLYVDGEEIVIPRDAVAGISLLDVSPIRFGVAGAPVIAAHGSLATDPFAILHTLRAGEHVDYQFVSEAVEPYVVRGEPQTVSVHDELPAPREEALTLVAGGPGIDEVTIVTLQLRAQ